MNRPQQNEMLTAKEEFPKKIQIAHSKVQIPTANQNAHSKTKSPQQNEKSTAKENHDPQHQDEAGQVAWLQLPRSARLGLARFFVWRTSADVLLQLWFGCVRKFELLCQLWTR